MDREDELRLRFVGSAHSRVRVMDRRFADQARNDFATYVRRTPPEFHQLTQEPWD